jgi:hypothetical protein
MNLREIKEELLRAATLVEDFEKNHLEIDRDAALNKMRQAYEALRFITPHTVIEEPAVEPLVPFTPDEESEPEVEVEFIMPEDDDEPTEEILPVAEPTEPATEEATEEEEAEQTEEEVVYVAEEDDDEVAETEAEPITEPEVEPIAEAVVEAEPEPTPESTPEPVAEEEPTAEAEDDFDIDEAFEPEEEPEPTIEPVVEAEPEPEAEPKRVVVEPSLFGDYEPIVKRSTPSRRKIMALYEDEPTPAPTPKVEPKAEPVVESEPTPAPAPTPAPVAEPKVEPIVDGENKVLGEVITPTTTIADTIAPVVSVAEDRPVETLRSAISVVDRFMLIRDLFDDDDQLYEQTIDELEKMDNLDDCIIYIAENFAWRPSSEGAKLMMDLLQRKLG